MKYIKNIVYVSLAILILFSFSACGKKTEEPKNKISFQEDPDEIVSEILSENDKETKKSKDKYKSKYEPDDSDRAPNMSDYNFNREAGSDDNINVVNGKTVHEYKGGICIHCGIADKKNPYLALSTLIKKNGSYDSNKLTYSIDNMVGDDVYSLIFDTSTNSYILSNKKYKDKKIDKEILLDLSTDKEHATVKYKNKSKNDYSCVINMNKFTTDTNIYFEKFSGSEKSKETVEHDTKNSCNVLMTYFDKTLKDFDAGLTIKDFGFTNYNPIGSKDKK